MHKYVIINLVRVNHYLSQNVCHVNELLVLQVEGILFYMDYHLVRKGARQEENIRFKNYSADFSNTTKIGLATFLTN